jgi:subtilase family serine protease
VSYGIPEHYLTFYEKFVFDTEIMKLGLQGVTILAAAGDSGVAGNDSVKTGTILTVKLV